MPLQFSSQDQQLLLASFEHAAIGAAMLTADGRWKMVNQALCDILGYTRAELLATDCQSITHPDDRENDLHHIQLLLDGDRQHYQLEKRYLHRDGSTIWARVTAFVAHNGSHDQPHMVIQTQDITEEKKQLALIHRHTRRLREIVTTQSLLANAQLGLDGFMNTVVTRMQAITPATGAVVELVEGDEMVYRAASGSVAPFIGHRLKIGNSLSGLCVRQRTVMQSDDTATDPRVDAAACKIVGAGSMIVAPLLKNAEAVGVLKVLALQPHAFGHEDIQTLELMAGMLGHALAHQLDYEAKQTLLVENRKVIGELRAEMALRERFESFLRANESRTRRILEASLDAFVGMNHSGIITEWNRQAEITFGWQRDEVVGRKLGDVLIPAAQRTAHSHGMHRFNTTGEAVMLDQRLQVMALTKSRGEIPVEMTISAIESDGKYQFHAFLHDITERKKNELRLQQMAQHDHLTGLPNRNLFFDRLEQALARNQRHQDWIALMFLDVDHFKQVNDTLGHAIGDLLLQAFSARIFTAIRASDTLARLGGDEFTLIAEALRSPQDAHDLAGKIVQLAASEFVLDDHVVRVSTSIGVALVHGQSIKADALVEQADKALYAAKKAGRNGFKLIQAEPGAS